MADAAKPKPLTIRQQRFAELLAAGCDQTDAYRQAFDPKTAKPNTVWVNAARMAKRPEVAAVVDEIATKARTMAGALIGYGLQDAVRQAQEAFDVAKKKQQASGMTQAVFLTSKLLGLLAEDRKNERTPLSELTDDQLASQIKDAFAGASQNPETNAALLAMLTAVAHAQRPSVASVPPAVAQEPAPVAQVAPVAAAAVPLFKVTR